MCRQDGGIGRHKGLKIPRQLNAVPVRFRFLAKAFMFSDTHFHFSKMCERTGSDGAEILSEMAKRACLFALDIGTESGDLSARKAALEKALSLISGELQKNARRMLHYTAGLWPSSDAIMHRKEMTETLEKDIASFSEKIAAIGECGIDRHWNPAADGRYESDSDRAMREGECELFEMQIELAKKLKLPLVVHSRDGFEDTYRCIKNSKYDRGIIHCFSYGIEEARAFLDCGWYISFSGSVTYAKRGKADEMQKLLSCIPSDRILCETDSPYLAPVPYRGKTNTPLFVEHVYRYVAKARNLSPEALSEIVDENCRRLFALEG